MLLADTALSILTYLPIAALYPRLSPASKRLLNLIARHSLINHRIFYHGERYHATKPARKITIKKTERLGRRDDARSKSS